MQLTSSPEPCGTGTGSLLKEREGRRHQERKEIVVRQQQMPATEGTSLPSSCNVSSSTGHRASASGPLHLPCFLSRTSHWLCPGGTEQPAAILDLRPAFCFTGEPLGNGPACLSAQTPLHQCECDALRKALPDALASRTLYFHLSWPWKCLSNPVCPRGWELLKNTAVSHLYFHPHFRYLCLLCISE